MNEALEDVSNALNTNCIKGILLSVYFCLKGLAFCMKRWKEETDMS